MGAIQSSRKCCKLASLVMETGYVCQKREIDALQAKRQEAGNNCCPVFITSLQSDESMMQSHVNMANGMLLFCDNKVTRFNSFNFCNVSFLCDVTIVL